MKIVNSTKEIPLHYIRLYAKELDEQENRVQFEFDFGLKRWLNKENLIALNFNEFTRHYYINRYKFQAVQ